MNAKELFDKMKEKLLSEEALYLEQAEDKSKTTVSLVRAFYNWIQKNKYSFQSFESIIRFYQSEMMERMYEEEHSFHRSEEFCSTCNFGGTICICGDGMNTGCANCGEPDEFCVCDNYETTEEYIKAHQGDDSSECSSELPF